MITVRPNAFVDELTDENADQYLFKVQVMGEWMTTQDIKPFVIEYEYRKIAWVGAFENWLKAQPERARKTGMWEEITEIWRIKKHYKKYEQKDNYEDSMVLIWSKEKGWLDNIVYVGGIING